MSVRRDLPLLEGIRPYARSMLSRDVLAGIALAALAIPEVMGYARIAGTPVVTGLYTLLLPAVAFALLGSSRHLVVGGDSVTAAMLFTAIAGMGIAGLEPGTDRWLQYACLAALITGGLVLLARLAGLGFLADFISRTVLVGFLAGVGISVALGQLPDMLGVPAPDVQLDHLSGLLLETWQTVLEIPQLSLLTVAIAVAVIVSLLAFERWLTSIPGGLVAVVGAIVISALVDLQGRGVAVVGPVPGGLPPVALPHGVGIDDAMALLPVCLSMTLVILAQSAATSRAYAIRYRERFVEDHDLVGLGVANIVAGLSSAFPVNGSPTKTEMADEAHARTQVAMLSMAATALAVLLFLSGPLQYLPEAVLAAVVFLVGLKLVDLRQLREIARLRRDEFVLAVVTTVVVVVVGIEEGIVLAIILSVLDHVRRHYDPRTEVLVPDASGHLEAVLPRAGARSEPGLVIYRFSVGLFFANSERLTEDVLRLVDDPEPPRWVILVATAMDDVDYTGARALADLAERLRDQGIQLAIAGASEPVRRELAGLGVSAAIGPEHVYDGLDDAIGAFRRTTARG